MNNMHGVALIINNIEWQPGKNGRPLMKTRDGARGDANALKKSLKDIGYQVIYRENLTAERMKQTLMKVRTQNVHPGDDSFVCFISSHGGECGVYGVDKKCVTVDELSKFLEPDKCPQLMHKPKIFFVQACRGSLTSEPIDGGENEFVSCVPRKADFYFGYATIPSHVALRHTFTRLLNQCLKEHSAQLSLDEIVMEVNRMMSEKVHEREVNGQLVEHMPTLQVVHTMRGSVYFK